MLRYRYIQDVVDIMKSGNELKSRQSLKCFPSSVQHIYHLMEAAGFSPSAYRNSWHDLRTNLPSDEWSASHFVEYMEAEIKLPRRFPIDLDLGKLADLSKATVLSHFFKSGLIRSLLQAQIDYNQSKCVEDPAFWLHSIDLVSRIGSPVLVFGDSHSLIYRQTVRGVVGRPVIPLTILCGGGSASGLPNADSRSGYGNMIRRAALALNEANLRGAAPLPVAFAFGQVDIEFVHTYRRMKTGIYNFDPAALESFMVEFARKYVAWIANLRLSRPVVVGINPPCIDDDYITEAYLAQMQVYVDGRIVDGDDPFGSLIQNFNRLDFPTKQQRTSNHERLNRVLRSEAGRHGMVYADSFSEMLGDDHCIVPHYACASDGTALHVGLTGKDIHIGGQYARKAKASLLRSITKLAAKAYRMPS